jgi:hypothetical protein
MIVVLSRACYALQLNNARLGHETQSLSSDVSDDEWVFVAPYLPLMTEDTPQRTYSLREVFHGVRWIAPGARHGR